MSLVDLIVTGNYKKAQEIIEKKIESIFEEKLEKIKTKILESNVVKTGRVKLVKLRIRGGKVQRRRKFSSVPGYTYRGGKLVRMSPLERRRRKLGARRAKIKLRAKKNVILRKRKISIRKRKSLGLK